MAKAREGDDRSQHLCTLTPSLALYDVTPPPIADCDQDIERVRSTVATRVDPATQPLPPPTTTHRQPPRNAPAFALRTPLSRIPGVDLTPVPGFQAPTLHVILAEVGLNRPTWPTENHCASWLGLCPDHQSSGGTGRATGRRRGQNRARRALRRAAQRLRTSPSELGAFFRRMRSTLGPAKATTATAHTLAKILYRRRKAQPPYRERSANDSLYKEPERQMQQVHQQAKSLGFTLGPQTSPSHLSKRRHDCTNRPPSLADVRRRLTVLTA